MIFDSKKGRFFNIPPPPPPATQASLKQAKKWVSSGGGGGGSGVVWTKNSLGDVFIGQNNDLQGVKETIQPLEVGYTNRPQKGGMRRFPLHAGLRGFDLTAR